MRTREVRLRERPRGAVGRGDFEVAEVELAEPRAGEILVRNAWISLEPSQRLRMDAVGYLPPFDLGAVPEARAVGEILASRTPGWEVGEHVISHSGWRECAVVATDGGRPPERLEPDEAVPERWHLGPLGRSGMTAYVGLFDVAELREGDVVFVSAAAGAVGGVAVQIAKAEGHTVIASAGTAEKADYAWRVLGADRAFCYRDGEVAALLAAAAPEGIDVYFDNVGGDHLEAALEVLRPGGRVALCGAVSTYNTGASSQGPSNLFATIAKGLTLRGFLTGMYEHRREDFRVDMRDWLTGGWISCPETVFDGLEGAVEGFIAMLEGRTVGKTLVRL